MPRLQHDLDSQTHEKAVGSQLLDLAQKRLAQGAILEPNNDNALYYVNQLRAADPANAGLAPISGALQAAIIVQARAAAEAGDTGKADTLIDAASGLGYSPELGALRDTIAQQKLKRSRTVLADSLVALKPMKLDYPRAALTRGTEGWVDLDFEVTTEGKVTNITVSNASPPNVFDSAAKSALSRVRYKPVTIDGRAVDVKSSLHVVFRLEKE